jgi:hypothetical protein
MIKLASDENFDGDILRGLIRRMPELDIVRVQDVGLASMPDPAILAWTSTGHQAGRQSGRMGHLSVHGCVTGKFTSLAMTAAESYSNTPLYWPN